MEVILVGWAVTIYINSEGLPEPAATRKGEYRHHILWRDTQALHLSDEELIRIIKCNYGPTEVFCGILGGTKKFYWR